jgi:hypothetical protein
MSQIDTRLSAIRSMILSGQLPASEEALLSLTGESPHQSRQILHYLGIIRMRQGNLPEAITYFLNAIESYGSHLFLILDLAAAFYLVGDLRSWHNTLDRVDYEYSLGKNSLSTISKAKFLLSYGKMREEQAEISLALKIYNEALNLEEFKTQGAFDQDLKTCKIKLLAQKVRLQSQYLPNLDQLEAYQILLQNSASKTDHDCAFEVEHALLLFESKIFGLEFAKARIKKIENNPIMNSFEARMVYADYIYELLLSNCEVPTELVNCLMGSDTLSNADSSIQENEPSTIENAVIRMALHQTIPLDEVLSWSEKLSPAAHLRLLFLYLKLNPHQQVNAFLSCLISTLSDPSRKIWASLITSELGQQRSDFVFDFNTGKLHLGSDFMDLKNTADFELISLFIDQEDRSTDEIAKILWNGSGSESDQARLRMRISRLNKKIMKKFAVSNFFSTSKSSVSLTARLLKSS